MEDINKLLYKLSTSKTGHFNRMSLVPFNSEFGFKREHLNCVLYLCKKKLISKSSLSLDLKRFLFASLLCLDFLELEHVNSIRKLIGCFKCKMIDVKKMFPDLQLKNVYTYKSDDGEIYVKLNQDESHVKLEELGIYWLEKLCFKHSIASNVHFTREMYYQALKDYLNHQIDEKRNFFCYLHQKQLNDNVVLLD